MTDDAGTYRTKSGRLLTEAEIRALAEEAERGYDIEPLEEATGPSPDGFGPGDRGPRPPSRRRCTSP